MERRPLQLCQWCSVFCHNHLCPSCEQALVTDTIRCQRCALQMLQPAPFCGECLAAPPAFQQILCADDHVAPFHDWLNRFKSHADLVAGELLIQRLLSNIRHVYLIDNVGDSETSNTLDCSLPQWLVPTPLHWWTQWQRGFNQSAWIAKRLSQQLHLPALNALQRPIKGKTQKSLSRKERQQNLKPVFKLKKMHQAALRGSHVALIDDVVTTGATSRLLSDLLIKAGAARVDVWCLTRTPKLKR